MTRVFKSDFMTVTADSGIELTPSDNGNTVTATGQGVHIRITRNASGGVNVVGNSSEGDTDRGVRVETVTGQIVVARGSSVVSSGGAGNFVAGKNGKNGMMGAAKNLIVEATIGIATGLVIAGVALMALSLFR